MKGKQKFIIVAVLLIAMFLQMGAPIMEHMVYAAGGMEIDSIKLSKDTLQNGETVMVTAELIHPGNLKKGETFSFKLPEQLTGFNNTVDIVENGEVIARGTVNSGSVDFEVISDSLQDKKNIKGSFFINAEFNAGESSGSEKLIFSVDGNYKEIEITTTNNNGVGPGEITDVLRKYGKQSKDDPNIIDWTVEINGAKKYLHGFRLIDTIGSGHELVEDSITLVTENRYIFSQKTYFEDHIVSLTSTLKQIDLMYNDNLNSTFNLYYKTKITDKEDNYKNKVDLISDNEIIKSQDVKAEIYNAGGIITGDLDEPTIEEKGSLQINKIDADTKEVLEGAEFKIIKDGVVIKDNLITNEDGKITVQDLEVGNYDLIEVKAPKGYLKEDKEIKFEIKSGAKENLNIELNVENKKEVEKDKLGKLEILKVSADNNMEVIEGTKFKLLNDKNEVVRDNLVTDKNGKIIVEDLKLGKYELIEVEASKGFIKNIDSTIIKILDENEIVKVTVENKPEKPLIPLEPAKKQGRLIVRKVDKLDSTKVLEGAEFNILQDGRLVKGNLVTNEYGEIIVNNLDLGKYKLVEIKAPKGYILGKEEIPFEIKDGDSEVRTIELIVKNEAEKPVKPIIPEEPIVPNEPIVPVLPNIPVEKEPEIPEEEEVIEEDPEEELVAELEDIEKETNSDKPEDIGEPMTDEKDSIDKELALSEEVKGIEDNKIENTIKLPKTGTAENKFLIIGLILLILGSVVYFIDNKKTK